jgi:hypothetical protein
LIRRYLISHCVLLSTGHLLVSAISGFDKELLLDMGDFDRVLLLKIKANLDGLLFAFCFALVSDALVHLWGDRFGVALLVPFH